MIYMKMPLILKIEDLALLKSNPEEYYRKSQLKKTHDGTSLGKIRNHFKTFVDKHKSYPTECCEIYDSDGNIIYYGDDGKEDCIDLMTSRWIWHNQSNLHYIHNHPSEPDNIIGTCFSESDTDALLVKNEGEYVYNGATVSAPNGFMMTITKNNRFNLDDEEPYREACGKLRSAYFQYEELCTREFGKTLMNYEFKGNETVTKKELWSLTMKNLDKNGVGSLKNYLKSQGLEEEFIKCNCKLRLQ